MIKFFILFYLLFINFLVSAQQPEKRFSKSLKGKSILFDGINDQISVPYNPLLKINNGTLEATIKIVDSTNLEWHSIVTKPLAYQITLKGYQLATFDWKERKIYSFGPSLNDNKWHHVAFVFQDGITDGSQLYLDGHAVGSPFTYHIFHQTANLDIGGNNFWDQFFNGFIDEVRIWNRPLSLAEINQNATTEVSKYSNGLLLYFKFNNGEGEGNNSYMQKVYDETANKLDGYFFDFTLDGAVSNYSSETIIKPYSDNKLWSFIVDQRMLILWSLISIFAILILYKFRIRYLVNQNKKLETIVENRTEQLAKMVDEKDVLIQEIHHRVKNNLQVISSMLQLEISNNRTIEQQKPLLETARRLYCMSLVHEQLYRVDNFENIDIKNYIETLVTSIHEMSDSAHRKITFNLAIEPIQMLITQCIPVGLIISEMVSNAIKHAFENIASPKIIIELIQENNDLIKLTIKDNGIGIQPKQFHNSQLHEQHKTLGMRLVDVFSRQLKGELHFLTDTGFGIELTFKRV